MAPKENAVETSDGDEPLDNVHVEDLKFLRAVLEFASHGTTRSELLRPRTG